MVKPPIRYFIGCVLMAAVSVLLERDSRISSGGVSGLSIGLADYLHLSSGIVNLSVKLVIFGFVFVFGGKSTGFWTIIAAGITGISMWMFEQLPIDLDLPKWIAFVMILLFAKLPIGLLASKGYSTGGFTAIGQILQARSGIPLWASLLILNLLPAVAMLTAHGPLSGALTATIALSAGIATEAWANITRRILDGYTTPSVTS